MASLRSGKNTAIGLYADGSELKLAKLSIKGGNVSIDELHTVTLSAKLEEKRSAVMEISQLAESPDTFALPQGSTQSMEGESDNNSVILSLLSRYPTKDYVLGYAISEPSVYYHALESDGGASGKKLKDRIAGELRMVRPMEPAHDAIEYFATADKNLMCVVREDGMSLLRLLEEVRPYLGKRLPKISLIEVSDVALLNLARANYAFNPSDITAVVYIGVEFTRLIFMRGSEFLHFAPILGEGFDSPNVQNTVYSRLLLEQDNMGIPKIDRVLLAGECGRIAFHDFLKDQLPEVEIQYMNSPQLNSGALTEEHREALPEYAVPIACAWKMLQETKQAFYPINLLPADIREGQKTFKLAWHGYLLMLLVFLSSFYFTSRYSSMRLEVETKSITVGQLQTKVDENNKIKEAISALEDQINRYNSALATYDSLVPGAEKWNRMVAKLTKGVADIGSLWITELKAMPDGYSSIQGYAVSRNRIPRIAALFDNATLTRVEVKEIREKSPPVYNFVITVPPQEGDLPATDPSDLSPALNTTTPAAPGGKPDDGGDAEKKTEGQAKAGDKSGS